MSIMNVSNLFNGKNNRLSKDALLQTKDKMFFAEILNKEKRNLVVNKQNTLDKSLNGRYTGDNSSRNQIYSVNTSNKPSNKDSSKLHSKQDKELKGDEEIDNKESVGNSESELLDHIISLLQNLLANIPVDDTEMKNELKLNIELLIDLKDQLSSLVDIMNFEADPSLGESIKATLSELTTIIDESLLADNKVSISELLSNIEELKSNLELASKNIIFAKDTNLQNMNNKNNLVDIDEENLSKDDTALIKDINVDEESNIKIKNSDKSLLSDSNGDEDFFKHQQGYKNIVTNDNILASQQEKFEQTINVSIVKNEVVEPKQFISEIAQKASAFLSKDRNEMNIQLTPENLGKISITIGLNNGTLTGKIYADNYSVKEIIEANLNQLRDALEENGLNIAGLEVNVGDNSQNFGNRLFQQRIAKTQRTNGDSIETNSDFITLEQDINQRNPYLVSGQFDGLV